MPQNRWDRYLVQSEPQPSKWDKYLTQPEPDNRGFIKRSWDWINAPTTDKFGLVQNILQAPMAGINRRLMGDKTYENIRDIGTSATNQLSSPANIGMMALTGGTLGAAKLGAQGLASGLNTGLKAASVPYAATGAVKAATGDTWTERGLGAVEAVGGVLGAKYGALPNKPKVNTTPDPNVSLFHGKLADDIPKSFEPAGLLTEGSPRFQAHPTGKVGDVRLPDTPEAMRSLDLSKPGTGLRDIDIRPDQYVNIEGTPKQPWNFDAPRAPLFPEPYNVPRSQGIQSIKPKGGRNPGEVTSRDYLTEQGNIFSTVPNRLRQEAPNVSAFRNLAGDTPVKPKPVQGKVVDLSNAPIPKFPKPSYEMLPPTRGLKLNNPVVKQEAKVAAEKTGVDDKIVTEALNTNPVVRQTVMDWIRKVNPLTTGGTELKNLGPAGSELYRRSNRFTHLERFRNQEWSDPYKKAVMKLSKEERENFALYAQGQKEITNPRLAEAVQIWHRVQNIAGDTAVAKGMVLETSSGKKVPFQKMSGNYYPHRLKEADIEKLPNRIDELVKEGLTRKEAETVVARARSFGELVLPQQHQRLHRRFDYDTTAESGLKHLEAMAKATARTEEFGRLDVAGKGLEGISDIIERTSDPARASEIMKRVIGRDEKVNQNLDNLVRTARTAVSWGYLQNYGISSIIGNQLPNMLRGSAKDYVRSLGVFIGRNKAITDKSAAALDLSHGILEQTRKMNPMKVYGGTYAENIVRGQSAVIGESLAKTYFRELRKNPLNQDARKQIFELVLENPDELLKQESLTDAQLRMASARNAELSQGIPNAMNLPMFMSEPVHSPLSALGQTALIFKKSAFMHGKMLMDAMKRNPIKTMALVTGFSQVGGGAIAGIKSGIRGAISGAVSGEGIGEGISQDYETRANYIGRYTGSDNEVLNKAIDRAIQSWAFGLGSDLMFLALDSDSWAEFAAGPVASLASDTLGNITNPEQLGREGIKMLPVPGGIGQGLQRGLLPTEGQR